MSFGLHLGLTLGGTVVAGGGAPATPATVDSVTAGTWTGSAQPITVAATGAENGDGVYWVIVPAADSAPSASEVRAGQANGGGSPTESGNDVWPGPFSDTLVSGIASGSYKIYVVIDNGALSNVGVSAPFTVDTTPADLGTPTVTGGTAVIDWAFTADEDSDAVTGYRVSYFPDGTDPSDVAIAAGTGATGTVTGTATDSVEESGQFTSVTAGVYQPAIYFKDAFGNETFETLADVTVTAAAAGPQPNGTPTNVYSTTSTGISSGTGSSITAAAGSDRLILAMFTHTSGGTGPLSLTLSMGAQAFTLAGALGSTTGSIAKAHFFYIKEADIPSGSQAISWTSDQPIATPVIVLMELTGVDQSTTIGGVGAAEATLSNASTTSVSRTTTSTNSMVVSLFGVTITQDQTFTTGTDSGGSVTQVTAFDLGLASGQSTACYEVIAGSGVAVSHTASWTPDASRWGKRSIEILAA